MAQTDDDIAARWQEMRKKGKWYFIAIYGMLAFGAPAALIWLGLMYVLFDGFDLQTNIIIALVLFLGGGTVWGWWIWNASEREFANDE